MREYPCPCCEHLDEPEHVLVEVEDADSGDLLRVKVPADQRHHPIGWGRAKRVRWPGDEGAEREGVELARGPVGVTVRDHDGREHRLQHGRYRYHEPKQAGLRVVLAKATNRMLGGLRVLAKASLGPGERWITVHPWGENERGVPVLIRENKDGSHSIIGGAGGKLNHLRLRNVEEDTPENREKWKQKANERRKAKQAKEAERKDGQSEEEKERETVTRGELEAAKRQAEREFIENVRAKLGGVSEDLDEAKLEREVENEAARKILLNEHHRKQLREARAALDARAREFLEDRDAEARENAMIHKALDADPEIADEARQMAEDDLELDELEREERARERNIQKGRQPAKAEDVGTSAAEAVLDHIDGADTTEDRLSELGGRRKPDPDEDVPASTEMRRQAVLALADARAIRRAVRGDELSATDREVVNAALKRLGLEPGADAAENAGALNREAARLARRSEIKHARADKLMRMEAEGDGHKAKAALAASELMTGISTSARAAKEMGLVDAARTELKAVEVGELRELLANKAKLREAQRAYKDMIGQAHTMDYLKARQAFDLRVSSGPMDIEQDLAEQERTHLARLLQGAADPGRPEHVQAVAAGHHEALADVTLGIAQQRYIDRTTIDAIGLTNAVRLARHALEEDGHDPDVVLKALEEHHLTNQVEAAREALARADAAVPGFTETVGDVDDIEAAMARLDAYEADLVEAQRSVGSTLGQLEAYAALAQAFREPSPSHIELEANAGNLQTQLAWLHSAGLEPGDYEIDDGTIRIAQDRWHKLQRRDPKHVMEQRAKVAAIKRGEHDEEGWLPPGIARRAKSTFTDPPPERPRFWAPLDVARGKEGIADHVGARLAEGEPPHEIAADLLSPAVTNNVPDRDAYVAHVKELLPLLDEQGEAQKSTSFDEHYRKLADDYIARNHPGAEAVAAVHSQDLKLEDPKTREAVFRSLAAMPHAKAAFVPVGQLKPEDRKALQDHFYKRQGIAESRNYEEHYQKALEELGPEPDKFGGTGSLFGGLMGGGPQEPSAEWKEWAEKAGEVTRMFPKEGRDLAHRLLGDAPEAKRHASITDEIAQHIDAVHREAPWLPADKVVQQVRRRMGEQEARNRGLDPHREDVLGRTAAEQFGPRLNPQHVHDYLAPRLHETQRTLIERRATQASTPWAQYVEMHKGLESAYQALQDEIRSDFTEQFAEHYAKVTGRPLQRTRVEIRNWERHRLAVGTMEEQAEWRKERAKRLSGLRSRDQGRYAEEGEAGAVLERERQAMEQEAIAAQQQVGLFGGRQAGMFGGPPPGPDVKQRGQAELDQLRPGERRSIGARAESQLESIMADMHEIDPTGSPVDLIPDVNMEGGRIHQQRVIKAMDAAGGRFAGVLGTGSGKSLVSIGAFTHAHEKGTTKHGLYLVPTAVQEQFGAEMLRYTEPGRYRWKTGKGLSHAQRVELLRNPDVHMRVLTHEAFRDTVVKVMAEHHGMTPEAMTQRLVAADHNERAELWRAAREANNIPAHFVYEDEAHKSFQRQGQPESALGAVMDAVSHPVNASHYLAGTATPVRNDESELYSMARRLDPERYADRRRFMTGFGEGLDHNSNALRRELDHQTYSAHITPEGVERFDTHNPEIRNGRKVAGNGPLQLDPAHAAHVQHVEDAYARARKASAAGGVDIEAIRTLSPDGWDHIPESEHEQIAREKSEHLAALREHALRRAINQAPPEINTKLRKLAEVVKHDLEHGEWTDRDGNPQRGKPSIVFSDSSREVRMITEHLRKQGVRAVAYHGGLSVDERKKIQHGYQPEGGGEPEFDVIVGTSAMEAGVNLQRAKVIHHYDVPQTYKSHAQRSGRAYRQGQKGNVEVHDWHTEHDYEQRALRRLRKKEGLHDVMSSNVGMLDETGIASAYHHALAERRQRDELPQEMAAK